MGGWGHVYHGRYKAILVENEPYLLELTRYIVLNQVRARMVRAAKDWPRSSYRATAGLASPPSWLHADSMLALFAKHRRAAGERCRAFVAAGKGQPSPWEDPKQQIYLGSETFVEPMQREQPADTGLSEIPAVQTRPPPKPLSHYAQRHRDTAIAQAYASDGYTLKQIGEHFGLHYPRSLSDCAQG